MHLGLISRDAGLIGLGSSSQATEIFSSHGLKVQ